MIRETSNHISCVPLTCLGKRVERSGVGILPKHHVITHMGSVSGPGVDLEGAERKRSGAEFSGVERGNTGPR